MRGIRRFRSLQWSLWGAALGVVNTSCLELFGDDPFIMMQSHEITVSEEAPAGYTCSQLDSGGATRGGEPGDDFWIRDTTQADGHRVVIGSGNEAVERRYYNRRFAAAGRIDRFIVETNSGRRHLFTYWGGSACERCPPVQFDELPGDPWGCAKPAAAAGTEISASEDEAPAPEVIFVGAK